jgi:hypothetical protein
MALDSARLASELDSMIADLAAEVTFGSSSFDASLTMGTVGSDISEGGFMPTRDIGLHCRATNVTRAISVGSKLVVSASAITSAYRVISIERSQDFNELIISCQSPRR